MGAIRGVTINGKLTPLPTFEMFTAARDKALFKMPKLNLTTENVTGALICFTLRDPCPNMAALCPEGDGRCTYAIIPSTAPCKCCPVGSMGFLPAPASPTPSLPESPSPSPAPEVNLRLGSFALSEDTPVTTIPAEPVPAPTFPFTQQQCNRTAGLLPFRLAGAPVASRTSAGNNMYCFTLEAAACLDPASPCCQADLLKVRRARARGGGAGKGRGGRACRPCIACVLAQVLLPAA